MLCQAWAQPAHEQAYTYWLNALGVALLVWCSAANKHLQVEVEVLRGPQLSVIHKGTWQNTAASLCDQVGLLGLALTSKSTVSRDMSPSVRPLITPPISTRHMQTIEYINFSLLLSSSPSMQ